MKANITETCPDNFSDIPRSYALAWYRAGYAAGLNEVLRLIAAERRVSARKKAKKR